MQYLARSDLEDLESRLLLYSSSETHYWADDWSPEFYRLQARSGFISIAVEHESLGPVLIPEIQSSYAVLDWRDLHLSRSMKRWMRSAKCAQGDYSLRVGRDLAEILRGVEEAHGNQSWLNRTYAELLTRLAADEADGFQVMTATLVSGKTGSVVAGELGYRVGQVYTSLTGFFDRSDPSHNNVGKLQLVLLAEHLENTGFAFWNLGHPSLQYKQDLGAKVIPRGPFLERWFSESGIGWSL